MTASPTPRHIAITGASSGLGAALALEYAGPGIRLSLHGRDTDRTEAVAAAARSRGAEVDVARFDVTDADAVAAWVTAIGAGAPLDLMIANAGISGNETGSGGRHQGEITLPGVRRNITIPSRISRPGAMPEV